MFAFGVAISDLRTYEMVALPGIRRAAEVDSPILTRIGYDSIQKPYNEMLDEAAEIQGLEALVLLHQDVELTDDSLLPRVRPLLETPDVGVIGALGWHAPGWHYWSGSEQEPTRRTVPGIRSLVRADLGSSPPRDLFGRTRVHHSLGSHEVEISDGLLLVLAPWVVRSLRFDERLARGFHGYDVDLSLRVRAAGGRVVCNDIPHVHHMVRLWRNKEEFIQARAMSIGCWDPSLRPLEWAASFEI